MTWSIVAHDPTTGAFAVAVTTCNLAVGATCPFLKSGVGAVSTQSMSNRYLGPAVLQGLERGLTPAKAIEAALIGDEGKGLRQISEKGGRFSLVQREMVFSGGGPQGGARGQGGRSGSPPACSWPPSAARHWRKTSRRCSWKHAR